jgi:hypothetical protein
MHHKRNSKNQRDVLNTSNESGILDQSNLCGEQYFYNDDSALFD